jgi:hypothetical protein
MTTPGFDRPLYILPFDCRGWHDSNPNIEALISKQYQMTETRMTKTKKPR